ncbi:MAG: hypothetical protein LBB53_01135 [Prevotellaceae bacterium]|nr:hypothetical protein [Prevotellaceae bacterium]
MNIIEIVVLAGILLKLSYVFVFLFNELDNGSFVAKAAEITFAFASVYFVVKVQGRFLKTVMVALDILTILYFYLHGRLNIPIEYSSIIAAAYSGFIVYYWGKTIPSVIDSGSAQIQFKYSKYRYPNKNE